MFRTSTLGSRICRKSPIPARPFTFTHLRCLGRHSLRELEVTQEAAAPHPPHSHHATPSFQQKLAQVEPVQSFHDSVGRPSIRNQVLFALLGSYVVFSFAAAKTNEDTNKWTKYIVGTSWTGQAPSNADLGRARYFALGKSLQKRAADLKESVANVPLFFRAYIVNAYVKVAQPYLDTTDGRRLCWKICLINSAVYLAWKIVPLQHMMTKNFMHNPLSGLSFTMLTSTFSHRGLLHLFLNCMALNSFGSAATQFLTREQNNGPSELKQSTSTYHFGAFFVSAGVFSSLVSHIINVKFKYPRMIAQLATPAPAAAAAMAATTRTSALVSKYNPFSRTTPLIPPTLGASALSVPAADASMTKILPSLGASGAIYACVIITALGYPESQIALVIPPSYPIPIGLGVGAMVGLDIIGALRGWRILDHWAHLGGAAFGAAYYAYGPRFWDYMREVNGGKAMLSAES